MTDEIVRLQTGGPEQEVSVEDRISAMIEKYSEFPQHVPVDSPADGKHVVSSSRQNDSSEFYANTIRSLPVSQDRSALMLSQT